MKRSRPGWSYLMGGRPNDHRAQQAEELFSGGFHQLQNKVRKDLQNNFCCRELFCSPNQGVVGSPRGSAPEDVAHFSGKDGAHESGNARRGVGLLQDGRVKRNSEINKATVDERPPVPIDRVANTNSVGID